MTTSTEPSESFHIPIEAAEVYETAFVPAFFAQWAPILCEAAGVTAGNAVLDVACGTGIVTRTAADMVEPGGRVVGLDLNEAMLTVAARVRPDLEWRQADVMAIPFPDRSFDVVLSQMALMFFADRAGALREMRRVVSGGGTVAVVVPDALDAQPAFAPFMDMVAGHVGSEAMSLLTTYFVCGNLDELRRLVESAGLAVTKAFTHVGHYRAPSVDAAVTTEVESTPLIERISEDVYRRIREDARRIYRPFTSSDGSLEAPFASNVVVARR
jgi:ubiquinone/menaquinone biosynthesis C-methylase UbiE